MPQRILFFHLNITLIQLQPDNPTLTTTHLPPFHIRCKCFTAVNKLHSPTLREVYLTFNLLISATMSSQVQATQYEEENELRAFKMPRYRKKGFWFFLNLLRYIGFCQNVHNMKRNYVVNRVSMDAVWDNLLEKRFQGLEHDQGCPKKA